MHEKIEEILFEVVSFLNTFDKCKLSRCCKLFEKWIMNAEQRKEYALCYHEALHSRNFTVDKFNLLFDNGKDVQFMEHMIKKSNYISNTTPIVRNIFFNMAIVLNKTEIYRILHKIVKSNRICANTLDLMKESESWIKRGFFYSGKITKSDIEECVYNQSNDRYLLHYGIINENCTLKYELLLQIIDNEKKVEKEIFREGVYILEFITWAIRGCHFDICKRILYQYDYDYNLHPTILSKSFLNNLLLDKDYPDIMNNEKIMKIVNFYKRIKKMVFV
jgi:hypothetical protein